MGPGQDLEQRLAQVVAAAPGRLGVAVEDDRGRTWRSGADRVTRSASTIKVPVLLAVLRLVQEGRLDLDDDVALAPPEERVGGSGPLSLLPSLRSLPLVEALRLMIALSDNDATNAVLDHAGLLGGDAVRRLLVDAGAARTRLRRRMMDQAAAAAGRENTTCAEDLVAVLVALRRGRLLDDEHTVLALGLLREQQLRDGLPAYLPSDVVVASKTGELPGLRADLALLERGGRWVAVAVVADDLADDTGIDRGTAVLPTFAAIGALAATRLGDG